MRDAEDDVRMQPSIWVNPGPATDVSLLFRIDGRSVMRRLHWERGAQKLLPSDTWGDAESAGLVPIERYTPPVEADRQAPKCAPMRQSVPEQPIGREWINAGPTREIAFSTMRIGKSEVDRLVRWHSGDVKRIRPEQEEAARKFGLVPLEEYEPDGCERWTHNGKQVAVDIGDLHIPYWIPGTKRSLPTRLHGEALLAGLEFLGPCA